MRSQITFGIGWLYRRAMFTLVEILRLFFFRLSSTRGKWTKTGNKADHLRLMGRGMGKGKGMGIGIGIGIEERGGEESTDV